MNRRVVRPLILLGVLMSACMCLSAQTPDQTILVKVAPATTVEERVANEAKEKALRKAAEANAAAEESAKIAATNPRKLLSRAHVLFIHSDTDYFEEAQLQNALRKRSEMDTWQLAIVDGWSKRDVADILIEVDRPLFTYTFTYKITDRNTGIILATGKVTAWDGNAAAPKLAERIIEDIRNAKGETKPKK